MPFYEVVRESSKYGKKKKLTTVAKRANADEIAKNARTVLRANGLKGVKVTVLRKNARWKKGVLESEVIPGLRVEVKKDKHSCGEPGWGVYVHKGKRKSVNALTWRSSHKLAKKVAEVTLGAKEFEEKNKRPNPKKPSRPPELVALAKKVRRTVEAAQKDLGPNLRGFSKLDLVADQYPDLPLSLLREALIVAGYPARKRANPKKKLGDHYTHGMTESSMEKDTAKAIAKALRAEVKKGQYKSALTKLRKAYGITTANKTLNQVAKDAARALLEKKGFYKKNPSRRKNYGLPGTPKTPKVTIRVTKRKNKWGEYEVQWIENGKKVESKTYYTDDKDDRDATAAVMRKAIKG